MFQETNTSKQEGSLLLSKYNTIQFAQTILEKVLWFIFPGKIKPKITALVLVSIQSVDGSLADTVTISCDKTELEGQKWIKPFFAVLIESHRPDVVTYVSATWEAEEDYLSAAIHNYPKNHNEMVKKRSTNTF